MSDFLRHQIRFWLGILPDPNGGGNSAPLDPLARFKRAYFYGRGGEARGDDGR